MGERTFVTACVSAYRGWVGAGARDLRVRVCSAAAVDGTGEGR
jgi:hypothetical protein